MVNVGIDNPAHESTVENDIEIRIGTNSVKKIIEVKLWVDGKEKKTWTDRPFEMSLHLEDGPHLLKVIAKDKDGNSGEREARIGVNVPWDWSPSPTASPTDTPTPTIEPTPTGSGSTPTLSETPMPI